jgi:hypothetical protein
VAADIAGDGIVFEACDLSTRLSNAPINARYSGERRGLSQPRPQDDGADTGASSGIRSAAGASDAAPRARAMSAVLSYRTKVSDSDAIVMAELQAREGLRNDKVPESTMS